MKVGDICTSTQQLINVAPSIPVSIKNESAEDYKFFLSVLQPFIVAPFKVCLAVDYDIFSA